MSTFRELAALCEALGRTRSRLELARRVAEFLSGLAPDEVRPAVRLLLGQAGRGDAAVSGATLWRVVTRMAGDAPSGTAVDLGETVAELLSRRAPVPEPPALGIAEVDARLDALGAPRGAGSRAAKERLLADLLAALTPVEAKYVARNLVRDMRIGAAEGVLLDALASLAGGDRVAVRRAHLVEGDLAEVAVRVLAGRGAVLAPGTLTYFRPLRPMLAETAETAAAALATFGGRAAVEEKLDGARVQIHKRDGECRLFSRRLQDLTRSLPDVVALVAGGLAAPAAIVEGEVIPVDANGRPAPFQELMRRLRRRRDVDRLVREVPVRLELFDALQVGDEALIDRPYAERWDRLVGAAGEIGTVSRIVATSDVEAEAFYAGAVGRGLEGVMVKSLDAPYAPGVRGRGWLKVKRATSVDLVIVAAEWGYGRRHGWLSNYHLAARDEDTGRLEPVGKTFKGLTDAEFRAMTARLSALEVGREGNVVFVTPQVVVEVLFADLQRSPTYRVGLALRFARIARIRDDKTAADADTLQHLRALLARQDGPR